VNVGHSKLFSACGLNVLLRRGLVGFLNSGESRWFVALGPLGMIVSFSLCFSVLFLIISLLGFCHVIHRADHSGRTV
jgi:hypothetical protein